MEEKRQKRTSQDKSNRRLLRIWKEKGKPREQIQEIEKELDLVSSHLNEMKLDVKTNKNEGSVKVKNDLIPIWEERLASLIFVKHELLKELPEPIEQKKTGLIRTVTFNNEQSITDKIVPLKMQMPEHKQNKVLNTIAPFIIGNAIQNNQLDTISNASSIDGESSISKSTLSPYEQQRATIFNEYQSARYRLDRSYAPLIPQAPNDPFKIRQHQNSIKELNEAHDKRLLALNDYYARKLVQLNGKKTTDSFGQEIRPYNELSYEFKYLDEEEEILAQIEKERTNVNQSYKSNTFPLNYI
jgi:hypothetical protein